MGVSAKGVTHVIIDEVHERTTDVDTLNAILLRLHQRRHLTEDDDVHSIDTRSGRHSYEVQYSRVILVVHSLGLAPCLVCPFGIELLVC